MILIFLVVLPQSLFNGGYIAIPVPLGINGGSNANITAFIHWLIWENFSLRVNKLFWQDLFARKSVGRSSFRNVCSINTLRKVSPIFCGKVAFFSGTFESDRCVLLNVKSYEILSSKHILG